MQVRPAISVSWKKSLMPVINVGYRMVDIGSAWLPVCHLRSLSKLLPGFIAGTQGVKQTFNLRQFCATR